MPGSTSTRSSPWRWGWARAELLAWHPVNVRLPVLAIAAVLTVSACGSENGSTPSTTTSTSPSVTAARTPQLDAIAVIGHSGATGYNSTGTDEDVPENSWATGSNPKVDSIYSRLLASHPALKGHAYNAAVSGSDSNDLMRQAQDLLVNDPVPDIVFIQSVDNDLQCDGSDAQNLPAFKSRVADVITFLRQNIPGVKLYFDDQAEVIRHVGHADILREQIDGVTGR